MPVLSTSLKGIRANLTEDYKTPADKWLVPGSVRTVNHFRVLLPHKFLRFIKTLLSPDVDRRLCLMVSSMLLQATWFHQI